ncbi:MAG: Holliday junction branch migration protein RuvA [Bacilli bacterium]
MNKLYNYIKGIVTIVRGDYIVIEANGIGYLIKTGNPFSFEVGKEVQIHTYLHVREDILDLYGFKSVEERDLFLKLISVKGIGPKGAMAIIASGAIDKVIQAIQIADSKYLQRFPGIGPKASQQIILDLHGKLDLNQVNAKENPKFKDIRDALKAMGYSNNEIKAIQPTMEANLDKPINELIKIILKKLI